MGLTGRRRVRTDMGATCLYLFHIGYQDVAQASLKLVQVLASASKMTKLHVSQSNLSVLKERRGGIANTVQTLRQQEE